VLIEGFQVAEIEFNRMQTTSGIAYQAVVSDRVVGLSCSLYVALPDVRHDNMGTVANAGSAIFLGHIFRLDSARSESARTIQFAIGDLSPVAPQGGLDVSIGSCRSSLLEAFPTVRGVQYPPIVSALRVGCMAFASDGIVGATRLQGVALDELPESQLVLTNCSGQNQSGSSARLCMAPETIGRCKDSVCQSTSPTPATDAGISDGAAANVNETIDAASLNSSEPVQLPVKVCNVCNEGRVCSINTQIIGRCVDSMCKQVGGSEWVPPLVISDCAASFEMTDGLNCFDSEVQGYGTCYSKVCRTRCVNSGHCSPEFGLVSGVANLCAHARPSSGGPPSYLGVCLPMAWFDGTVLAPNSDAGRCVASGVGSNPTSVSVEAPPDDLASRFCVAEADSGEFTCN
jgi:hypothetical protein